MQLWINASKLAFLIASKATVMSILIMLAFLIPFYNAIRFEVAINYWFIIEVFLSIPVTLFCYFFGYGFGKFDSIMSKCLKTKSKKTSEVSFLSLFLIMLVAFQLILYWKFFTATEWVQHENIFNHNLVLLAVFYGIGNFCFLGSYLPKRSLLMKEYLDFYQSGELLRSSVSLTIIVGIILILGLV
ncbi:hypothetical protein [Pseudocolwellia agarivorans]|uniref:hypothetical protein n=1 Tax=Pseudocolwellia agarivorans TaxID=1911682 RepID=UPI003F8848E7